MSTTKHRSSAGKSVAIFFIVFIILEALIIFGVSRIFKNKDVTPSIAGYSMYIMDSDAMGDSVPQGSLVIASNSTPTNEALKKAVLCEEVPGVGTSVFWLADVQNSTDLNTVVYTVFQEKNPTKLYELKPQNVIGTATTYYETAGKIITFMTSKFGMIILLVAPVFLLVLIELIIMVVNRARYGDDDYDDEDEDDEDDEENPVKLDDFLFGGKNDEEIIKNRVHSGEEAAADIAFSESVPVRKGSKARFEDEEDYEEEAPVRQANPEDIFNVPAGELRRGGKQPAEPEPVQEPEVIEEPAPKPAAPEPVKEAAPKPAPEKPARSEEIHPSYYEKAAKLIDEGEEAAAKVAVEPAKPVPVKEAKPAKPAAPKPDMKKVSAGFEDLMKLMEQETGKLKNQLDDK